MSTTASPSSNLTRGYTIALVSAAILSTTAIFIRHLTQTYHMPPLVLAFWRDGLVALTLLPVLGWLAPPRPAAGETPTPALSDRLRACAGGL